MKSNLLLVTLLSLSLCGCASSTTSTEETPTPSNADTQEQTKEKDFDGSNYTETAEGDFYIGTMGGTSEDGKVPTFASNPDTLTSIDIDSANFPESTIVDVYIDGMKKQTITLGFTENYNMSQISVSGDDLTEGTHIVEIVAQEGDQEPTVYKKAEYKVVSDQ